MGSGWLCSVLINSGLTIDSYRELDGTPDDNRPVVQESHTADKNHKARTE
jgi:hypothetical protein